MFWPRWSTYSTTWLPFNMISYFYSFPFVFLFKSGGIVHHGQLIFLFLFIHGCLFYPFWGGFQMLQVSNIHLGAWILDKSIRVMLNQGFNIFYKLTLRNKKMIIVRQGMWIIQFEHDNESFQSNQSLLYEFNLKGLPLDQV